MATFLPSGINVSIREDLVEGSARTATTLNIDPIITKDGTRVTMAHIGDIGFAKLDQGTSNEEIMSFTGITDNTDTYQLTGCVWGYEFHSTTGDVDANKKKHVAGASFIITNDFHFINTQFFNKDDDQTVTGLLTFSQTPINNGGNPTSNTELATKAYVDLIGTGSATYDQNLVSGLAGETVAAGNVLYLKESDGKWYKADASASSTCENVIIGIAQGAATAGNNISGGVLIGGIDKNATYTAGSKYYITDTAGTLGTSPGTVEVLVGTGDANNNLVYEHNATIETITAGEKDALVGTSGTPSASNKYVTADDVAEAKTASKIARRDANSDVLVATTPTAGDAAASKTYVDTQVAAIGASTRVYTDTTAHTFTDSNTENTILTTTITGGSLSTANILKFKIYWDTLNTDSSNVAITFRLKYGSTTIATATVTDTVPAANTMKGIIDGEIIGAGSTSSQVGVLRVFGSEDEYSISGLTADAIHVLDTGTAAEDSTGNLTFTVTAQLANANADFQSNFGYIELIK